MVRISLDVQQDTIERLESLSELYDKSVKEIISEVIEAISYESGWLLNISKEYKVPMDLMGVISILISNGVHSTYDLFDKLLERLEGKGLFCASDMEIDPDEMSIWIYYDALRGCDLYINSFDLTLTGLKRLTATYMLDAENIDETILERIYEITDNIFDIEGLELPETFHDVMDISVDVVEEEDYIDLNVDITEDSLSYLPSLHAISELFKQILERAGIDLPIEE